MYTTFNDYIITPAGIPNEGTMFADLSKVNRGGHLGHALVQCKNGDVLAFYPNCSDDNHGHSGNGWMEYKRSADGGKTWQEPLKLPRSFHMWQAKCGATAMAEKAVCCADGTILLFLLVCDMTSKPKEIGAQFCWEPYFAPIVLKSTDNGETFTDAGRITEKAGRVYDVLSRDDRVYVLFFANDARIHYVGNRPEHVYELYVSDDSGTSFIKLSELSVDPKRRCYGTMEFLSDNSLIAYVYHYDDEFHPDYCISKDLGATWETPGKAYCAKRIRNPQLIRFGSGYFMHGRSGNFGSVEEKGHLVIYYSEDAIHWDEGHILQKKGTGFAAYSNSLVVTEPETGRKYLYIHTSHAYRESLTNIKSFRIDMK